MQRVIYLINAPATHLAVVALPQVVGKVVLDVVGKLLLILKVQFEDFQEPRNEDALEVAICESLHITRRFDYSIGSAP